MIIPLKIIQPRLFVITL